MEGLPVSLVALLVSEACNIGLTPVINPGFAELTRSRLSHVDQNYLRGDTIAAANAALIQAQSRVPIAHGSVLAGTDLGTRPDSNCLSAVRIRRGVSRSDGAPVRLAGADIEPERG
jgi:hypothetical protein